MISDISIPFGKTLKPTYEEFLKFDQFMENCEKDKSLQGTGIFKVVPPKNWRARKTPIENEFDRLVVQQPIEQNAQGKGGVYELLLIQKKSMKLNEYRKKVECFDHLTDDKSIDEVEEMSIAFSPPLYGADMKGNLFDEEVPWNLKDLPGVLKDGLKVPVSGVNNPYLYVGSWKTMFGWHKEDLDLNSINFLHYGKPKFWYGIAPSDQKKVEDFARQYFPEGFGKCKEFMRHKTIMIHPYLLKQKIPDLKIHKMIQYPGEFVMTFAGGYHAGFNWGFNIAEAVNFATTRWFEVLPTVESCKCVGDTVKIEKEEFFKAIAEYPAYSKLPSVKKALMEYGLDKPEKNIDEEDAESEETTDSREHKGSAKKGKKEDQIEEEETKSSDKKDAKKAKSSKKLKEKVAKVKKGKEDGAEEEEEEEDGEEKEPVVQRISSRTKKIKKVDDDFETEEAKLRKLGQSTTTAKKALKKPIKQEVQVDQWAQCDSCNKWRILNVDAETAKKLLSKKKFNCINLPGRSCNDPEDSF